MRLIDADDFGNRMYHEVFEKDSEDQRWDSGCWMRYKLFERVLREQPAAQPQTSMLTVECKLDDEELAKAIEEVKKANLELIAAEPHWIPCSEQLPPEENKTYWVCTDNGHQHECRWTNANPFWTHLTTDWHWNIFDIPQYMKIVAWMELPKPYDGGEQDE